jgi:hypothetical protein
VERIDHTVTKRGANGTYMAVLIGKTWDIYIWGLVKCKKFPYCLGDEHVLTTAILMFTIAPGF